MNAGTGNVDRILSYLNRVETRCTYKAVGEVLGVPAQSVGGLLGQRRPAASWVVNGETGEPTDYAEAEKHPNLHKNQQILRTGDELRKGLSAKANKLDPRPLLLNPSLGIVLFLVGLSTLAGSFYLSLASGDGEWFQRSGSLFVLFSALVEIQQSSIKQPTEGGEVTINDTPVMIRKLIPSMSKWLHRIAWGGIVIGTLIWGYGDLVF